MAKRFLATVAGILLVASIVCAQEQNTTNLRRSATTVIAASTADHVRFTAPATVVQIRLEVYAASGEKTFDNEIRGGNMIDWNVLDGRAQRLSDGSYLCVITTRSLSGRISQKIGTITINNATVTVEPTDSSRLTSQQTQGVGPLEENAALTVVKEDENQTPTVIAHNGTEGQLVRGRGALSFRLGDFFNGKDVEQMRLTPEGNLGVGITNPTVKLDVDGLIRASRGIVFPDGSIQYSAARRTFGVESLQPDQKRHREGKDFHADTPDVSVSGSGTTGKIPKWSDGAAGVLADSNFTEVNGGASGIAIGVNATPSTNFRLDVNGSTRIRGSNPGFNLEGLRAQGNIWLFQTVDDDGRFRLFGQDNVNPGVERLTISLSTGNIGIGATVPAAKLDVAGDIRSGALRQELTASSPNVVGGFMGTGSGGATPGNRATAGVVGAAIGSGGFNGVLNPPSGGSPFSGDNSNRVTDWFGTVGGGFKNRAGDDVIPLDSAIFATVGGGDSNTASGSGSTVGGGDVNTASNAHATVAGGQMNTASGFGSSVGGGDGNNATTQHATVGGGQTNTASGASSTVGGGESNTANANSATVSGGEGNTASALGATVGGGGLSAASGSFSVVPGGLGASATHYGEMAFSSDRFASPGDAQTSTYTMRQTTTDATPTELFLDGAGTQRITIASGRAVSFDILVVAKTTAGQTAGYSIRGVIKNVAGVTSFVGTPTVTILGEDNAAWDISVQADNTNDALVVKATGVVATTIHWQAAVRTSELTF